MARNLIKARGHRVEYVAAHMGVAGNEMADKKAKDAARLQPQEAQQPRACGDLTFEGELCEFPNKTWTRLPVPSHSLKDAHPASFKPLQKKFAPWFKFIHGLMASQGYAHPASYWNNTMACTPCPRCATMHNH